MYRMYQRLSAIVVAAGLALPLHAQNTLVDYSPDSDSVAMYLVNKEGPGKYIGTVEVYSSPYGIVFDPSLGDLEPGLHGFHVHEDRSCQPNTSDRKHAVIPAGAAGNHFDPTSVNTHGGPWGVGHRGDLPNLYVNEDGEAEYPVLAPKLEWEFLRGRSLIIHANRDNYSDTPPNGGSGERIACGIFSTQEMDAADDPAGQQGQRGQQGQQTQQGQYQRGQDQQGQGNQEKQD